MAQDKILVFPDYRNEQYRTLESLKGSEGAWLTYRDWIILQYGIYHDGDTPPDVPAILASVVKAFVDNGRWLWECLDCTSAVAVEPGEPSICVMCGTDWVDVELPAERAEIEVELLRQPGFRLAAPVRQWVPDMTMEELQARTVRAAELKAQGVSPVRHLSLPSQRTWATGEVLTAANMNTYQRNAVRALSGRDGRIDLENAARIKNGTSHSSQPYLDLTQAYLGLPQAGADPTAGNGRMHYRTDLNRARVNINGTWESLATKLADFGVIISEDEPTAADWGPGDIWFVREA